MKRYMYAVGIVSFLLIINGSIVMYDLGKKSVKPTIKEVDEINWIGCPVVSNNDAYTPSNSWLPYYKIGFRSDGVVVWEKIKKGE